MLTSLRTLLQQRLVISRISIPGKNKTTTTKAHGLAVVADAGSAMIHGSHKFCLKNIIKKGITAMISFSNSQQAGTERLHCKNRPHLMRTRLPADTAAAIGNSGALTFSQQGVDEALPTCVF